MVSGTMTSLLSEVSRATSSACIGSFCSPQKSLPSYQGRAWVLLGADGQHRQSMKSLGVAGIRAAHRTKSQKVRAQKARAQKAKIASTEAADAVADALDETVVRGLGMKPPLVGDKDKQAEESPTPAAKKVLESGGLQNSSATEKKHKLDRSTQISSSLRKEGSNEEQEVAQAEESVNGQPRAFASLSISAPNPPPGGWLLDRLDTLQVAEEPEAASQPEAAATIAKTSDISQRVQPEAAPKTSELPQQVASQPEAPPQPDAAPTIAKTSDFSQKLQVASEPEAAPTTAKTSDLSDKGSASSSEDGPSSSKGPFTASPPLAKGPSEPEPSPSREDATPLQAVKEAAAEAQEPVILPVHAPALQAPPKPIADLPAPDFGLRKAPVEAVSDSKAKPFQETRQESLPSLQSAVKSDSRPFKERTEEKSLELQSSTKFTKTTVRDLAVAFVVALVGINVTPAFSPIYSRLFNPVLQLVGVVMTLRFVATQVIPAAKREALLDNIERLYKDITGRED